LQNGAHSPARVIDIASNIPNESPAAPAQVAGAISGIAIWAVVLAESNQSGTANSTPAQLALKNVVSVQSLATVVLQQQVALDNVLALAGQARLALLFAGNSAGADQADSIAAEVIVADTQAFALQSQIQVLEGQFASGTGTLEQLNHLQQEAEALRANTSKLTAQLNTLLVQYRNVAGVPNSPLNPLPRPGPASASVPLLS